MRAFFFGSIGTLSDTSELQRAAFNDAFASHGLDWVWTREEYRALLAQSGGQNRIEAQASKRGEDVDARAIHATKSQLFQKALQSGAATLRPGVTETIARAVKAGVALGLVTTTSRMNVTRLIDCLGLAETPFHIIVTRDDVAAPKPAADAYQYAAAMVGTAPEHCLAVEDNTDGVRSAQAAGVPCLAWPGENTRDHDFSGAWRVDGDLSPTFPLGRTIAAA